MKPLPIFFILFGLIGVIPLTWQNCLHMVFYLTVFEGAIRKWVVPGAADLVYFIKDVIVIIAYIKFYLQPPEQRTNFLKAPTLKFVLFLSLLVPVLQIFNPKLGSVILGTIGIRGYVLYMPLIFLLPSFFQDKEEFIAFIRRYLIISIGVCCLALVQYVSPANSLINRYAAEDVKYIATMGSSDNVRTTGTFSYISGFTTYLTFCFAFTIPLLTYRQSARNHFLVLAVLLFLIGGFLVSGSRGPLFSSIILLALYLILNKGLRGKGFFKKLILPIIFIGLIVPSIFSAQLTNFIGRITQNKDSSERISWVYRTVMENITDKGVFGYGTGASSNADAKIRKAFGLDSKKAFDGAYDIETGKIMIELGLIGFAFWYFMRLYLIFALWKTFTKVKTDVMKNYALIACLLHFINYSGITSNLVYNVTFQVYYWFMAGFIMLLPQLDAIEIEKSRKQYHQRLLYERLIRSNAISTKELR